MAGILWTDVVAHAPELAALAVGAQTDILALVNNTIDDELLGGASSGKPRLARILLAAHLGTGVSSSGGSTAIGSVTSESAGGLSRSYAVPLTVDSASLGTTSYGQAYLSLVRASPARVPFVP